jgi:spermidine synthase
MLLGLIFVEAKQVTILGLGGGGLVHCLNHFFPAINLKAVELRQLVINVAVEWFTLPVEESLQVFCDDAQYYMARVEPAETDLIFSDLYQASGMSEVQQQADFISHCSKALTDNGCLIINYHSMPNNSAAVMQQLQSLFSSVYICDVFKGNQVLFCIKTKRDYDKKELKTSLSKLEKKVEIPLMYYFKKLREYKW